MAAMVEAKDSKMTSSQQYEAEARGLEVAGPHEVHKLAGYHYNLKELLGDWQGYDLEENLRWVLQESNPLLI